MTQPFTLTEPAFIHETNQQYFANVPSGWLSVKCMFGGEAQYEVENGRLTVNDSCFLILNDRQPYKITIDSPKPVESFCIFFPSDWAGDVSRYQHQTLDGLLKTAVLPADVPLFPPLTHRHDATVTPHLQALRRAKMAGEVDLLWQSEQLFGLLGAIFAVQQRVQVEINKLPASRHATRVELYRRLAVGRDYIHANLAQPLSLNEIAHHASLSPYHFARSFKAAYGQTPHAYLTSQRLQKVKTLLAKTQLPITEICFAVGFQSVGSFSTLFQKLCGASPSAYRQQENS